MLRHRPLVMASVAFAVGIGLAGLSSRLTLLPLLAAGVGAMLLLITRREAWVWLTLFGVMATLGAAHYTQSLAIAPDAIARIAPQTVTITGVIASDVEAGGENGDAGRARFTLQAQTVLAPNGRQLTVSGLVRVTVHPLAGKQIENGVTAPPLPQYGDTIAIRGLMELPLGRSNPGGFDYRAFLARRGVDSVLTAGPQDVTLLRFGGGLAQTRRFAYGLRKRIIERAKDCLRQSEPPL